MRLRVISGTNTYYWSVTNAAPAKPYLQISNQYLPLTTVTRSGVKLKVQSGNATYRAAVYESGYYNTTSAAVGNLSSTTALTRASTSGTTYLTRASTSGTTYLTRASTSGTTYLTRASTSGYATRVSTSGYATRVSTSGYGTKVNTATFNTTGLKSYNSKLGNYGSTFGQRQYATLRYVRSWTNPKCTIYDVEQNNIYGVDINTQGDIPFIGTEGNSLTKGNYACLWQSGAFTGEFNAYTRTNYMWVYYSNGYSYTTYSTTNTSRYTSAYAFYKDYGTRTFSFTNNTSLLFPFNSETYSSYRMGTTSTTYKPFAIYRQFNSAGYLRSTSDYYNTSASTYTSTFTIYRMAGVANAINTTGQTETWRTSTKYVASKSGDSHRETFTYVWFTQTSFNIAEIYTSGNISSSSTNVVTTATLTRASTSATLTRASTSATLTRASTSGTSYGTRASTSGTNYGTRASTSGTNYGTRASTSGYSGKLSSSKWG